MQHLKLCVILFFIVLIVGCNVIKKNGKSDEYDNSFLHSKPLIMPADMNSKSLKNYYPIPKTEGNSLTDASVMPPRAVSIN